MDKKLLSRAAAAGLLIAAAAAHAAPVGLEILEPDTNSVYGLNNFADWTTTRSVVFTDTDGSVTSATAFKGPGAGPSIGAGALSFDPVSPLSKPASFAGLTTVVTASTGFSEGDGDGPVTTDDTGFGGEARVALGGTLTAGQSVTITSTTSFYSYLQTSPLAGQSLGDTVQIGVVGKEYSSAVYEDQGSKLLTADGVAAGLPGTFSASVSYSVFRVAANGSLEELYASGDVDPFGLPVTGSFSFQVGDRLVLAGTAELSLTVSGAKSFQTDIALDPTLYLAPAVPEPATWGLALMGLGGLALAARRRG